MCGTNNPGSCIRWVLGFGLKTGYDSFTAPPPPSGHEYWLSPTWAAPTEGQAPPMGIPPWTTPTPQPQRPPSSPLMISHSCLLSIVPFVIRANVERLAYSSIYVFKRPSLSAGHDFIDGVLNKRRFGKGKGGGTDNDAALLWSVVLYVMYLCRKMTIMYCCEVYGLSLWYICLKLQLSLFCYLKLLYMCLILEAPHLGRQPKQGLYKKPIYFSVNWGTYVLIFLD
jgi:hypothetical protein